MEKRRQEERKGWREERKWLRGRGALVLFLALPPSLCDLMSHLPWRLSLFLCISQGVPWMNRGQGAFLTCAGLWEPAHRAGFCPSLSTGPLPCERVQPLYDFSARACTLEAELGFQT